MDSALIEAAIGLVLVYLVFSLSVTSLNEAIASLLQLRGRVLYRRLQEIFAGEAEFILNDPCCAVSRPTAGRPTSRPPCSERRWPSGCGTTWTGSASCARRWRRRPSRCRP
ncbi:hypothetical protein [Fodinicurvata halophila]|uniref:hypothetical protein n=1 Tax=Fodinicurvata halophila TaxID=1419723 RepID=UPI0036399886